jgi:hypothetical protein
MSGIRKASFNADFNLYNKILDYDKYIRKNILSCIPAVHRDIRIHLSDESYNLTKEMFYAIYNKGNIRMKHLIEIQVIISTIDMLSTLILDFKCAPRSKVISSLKKLEEVKNIIYSWINNEEKKKQ